MSLVLNIYDFLVQSAAKLRIIVNRKITPVELYGKDGIEKKFVVFQFLHIFASQSRSFLSQT